MPAYKSLTCSCALLFTFSCLSELLCMKSLHSNEHSFVWQRAWNQKCIESVGRSIWCLSSSESSLVPFSAISHFPMKSAPLPFCPTFLSSPTLSYLCLSIPLEKQIADFGHQTGKDMHCLICFHWVSFRLCSYTTIQVTC